MFRLIALALTSTFALLFLVGTSGDPVVPGSAVMSAGFMRSGPDEAADGEPLQYVARPHQALKAEPDNAAGILQILPFGAPLLPMGETEGDFTKVRDSFGRVGFVRSDVLSASFPG
ncbi:MAG TPA: SH3 domain-containing protein [Paracoccus sp.]|nr:SH3 domain-containing protein [Paracoccus sp. (in: a-proteobacteria)]